MQFQAIFELQKEYVTFEFCEGREEKEKEEWREKGRKGRKRERKGEGCEKFGGIINRKNGGGGEYLGSLVIIEAV